MNANLNKTGGRCLFLRPFFPLFLVLAFFSFPLGAVAESLMLEDPAGKTLFILPVDPACGFAIRYTHSVALSPVNDYFVVNKDGFTLVKTVYEDFGAGLPHQPEQGQVMHSGNGKIVIEGMNRHMPEFTLRVGRVANHELIPLGRDVSGECQEGAPLPLTKISRPGSAITFRPGLR